MPALSSSSSEDDIYRLLCAAAEATWGAERSGGLDGGIRNAARQLKTLFSVPLSPRDSEPDYYDNATEGSASA